MTRIAVPALTIVLVVASFIGLTGWNRSVEIQPSITLTEQELSLWRPDNPDQNLGVQLDLDFVHRHEPLDARNWLPESRLRTLGFPLNVPPGDPAAAAAYADLPSRLAWVVLEYNGPVFQDIERRRKLRPPSDDVPETRLSRLVPIDAGLDVGALRKQYGAGHLILRAVISVNYSSDALVAGWVRELVPSQVRVPRHLVHVVDGIEQRPSPRYEVELGVGRLGVPFVKAIRRIGV